MYALYSLALYAATPLVLARLLVRSLRLPAYRRRWRERFGIVPGRPPAGAVWFHAVSVGEAQATLPLVRALRARWPGLPVAVTTTTPTGSERVRELYGDEVYHCYLPYDLPSAVARFLSRLAPRAAVVMETELWPNLFRACARRAVPVVVANARLSARSAAGYRRVRPFIARVLADTRLIAAQSEADAARFRDLGADPARVAVTGSVKFDIRLPPSLREQAEALRRQLGAERPVWIAASTHEGEEEQVLDALAQVRHGEPDVLLVLAPRHPERCDRVAALCRRRGLALVRRSEGRPVATSTAVYLLDTLGELTLFYGAADVAFVGGSLVPRGGHNVLEAAAQGIPVVIGPHTFNFALISRQLVEAGAARRVRDAGQCAAAVADLLRDPNLRHDMGERGRALVDANRGAVERLLARIEPLLGLGGDAGEA